MAVLGAVAFMAQLDFFVVNVALDGIGQSFPGTSVASVSWILSAYAIVFAAVLVPAGRIADHWGRKKMLLSGVALFTSPPPSRPPHPASACWSAPGLSRPSARR